MGRELQKRFWATLLFVTYYSYSSCRLNAIQLRAQTLRPYRIGDETLYLITAGGAV
jgi:hypothetical protein